MLYQGKRMALVVFCSFVLLLSGCGAAEAPASGAAAPAGADMQAAEPDSRQSEEISLSDETTLAVASASARKVIRSAEFTVHTADYAAAVDSLNEEIRATNSYVQESSSTGLPEDGNARSFYTIRVPVGAYDGFKTYLPTLGQVTNSAEYGEDVTAQYFDTEARLSVLYAQEARIESFIPLAADLEEIFLIEDELTRIRTEIEQLTTVVKRYDDLIAYATIRVELFQDVAEATLAADSFGSRVTAALRGSADLLGDILQWFVVALAWVWPYLLLLLLVCAFLCWRKRRAAKQRRSPKPAKPEKPAELPEAKAEADAEKLF